MQVKVRVNQQDYGRRVIFGFFKDDPERNKFYIFDGKRSWVEYDLNGAAQGEEVVTFAIPPEARDEVLQQLSDLLGGMGYKPQSVKAAAQEIDRLENHLVDTIKTRDTLLELLKTYYVSTFKP